MTTLWLDPRFGASGDMVLGTLVGLGADVAVIERGLRSAVGDLDPWTLTASTTMRCSLSATRVTVTTDEGHHHRTWSAIDQLLADADLDPWVADGARRTFRRLGEVEAGIHQVDIDQVHFHEVGAVDAIVDITGAWLALHHLDVDRVVCGPVGLGHGTVDAAHGILPLPAPATAALLQGAAVHPVDAAVETVTPTGAALLVTMADAWGPMPSGVLGPSARGAGGRNPDTHPNVISGYLIDAIDIIDAIDGSTTPADGSGSLEYQPSVVLATNVDDVSAEVVAHTIRRCLEEGADDAWATPIVMKKGRPAVELSVLCHLDRAETLRRVLMAETGTLGVRTMTTDKHMAGRRIEVIPVRGHDIRFKIGPHGAKPEYEDLASAGRVLGVPLRELTVEAVDAFTRLNSPGTGPAGTL